MKALLKSNRYTNYDFTPLKKLNRLRFIIFTPPSIFFGYKSDFEKKSIFRKKRMANLLSIVNQQQAPIDEEKLKLFCMRQNVWEYFGLKRDVFSMLSEEKQLKMVRKFYFDNISKPSNAFNIDSSIGSAIRNAPGLTMRKIIKSRDDSTEMTVDKLNSEEKV